MSESYLVVELNHQPVELCKLLKIANLVSGGGEAKVVISEGYVLLNGEVEYQKRKKVYHEDVIEFNGEIVQLMINETLAEAMPESSFEAESSIEDNQQSFTNSQSDKNNSVAEEKGKQKKNKAKGKSSKQGGKATVAAPIEQAQPQGIVPRKRRPISF